MVHNLSVAVISSKQHHGVCHVSSNGCKHVPDTEEMYMYIYTYIHIIAYVHVWLDFANNKYTE